MPTPYDGKIYLVQVKGSFLPRKSLGDVSRIIVDTMPNVDGVFLFPLRRVCSAVGSKCAPHARAPCHIKSFPCKCR